ncbi:MAG TPA: DinB family protein [Anaerolineales bacterium]|nr:DinB family protein [Anaerolineales bacterium]
MDDAGALAAKLQTEGDRLHDFMAGLGDRERATRVYTEGMAWTVRNILAHLMSAERAFLRLFQQILEGGDGVAEDFVIDRYNADQQRRTENMSWVELLDEYRNARASMVSFVESLPPADLERQARHPFAGVTSLREMIKMVYIHNQAHLRDIRRALKTE